MSEVWTPDGDDDHDPTYLCSQCLDDVHCDGADENCDCTCGWDYDYDEFGEEFEDELMAPE